MTLVHSGQEAVISTELVARLEAMTGPLGGAEAWNFTDEFSPWKPVSTETLLFVDALRGSIDAALGLADRVLPGWCRGVFEDDAGAQPRWLASLTDVCDGYAVEEVMAGSNTPALALCIAILKATSANSVDTSAASEL